VHPLRGEEGYHK